MKKLCIYFSSFVIAMVCFFYTGCSTGEVLDMKYVKITMRNSSTIETHMWTVGESINPTNKLVPGESRTLEKIFTFDTKEEEQVIFIAAGRNGTTIDYVEVTVVYSTILNAYCGVFEAGETISFYNTSCP